MYLTFYDLSTLPFHITPDPKFLYLSPSHKEALAAIVYGIEQRKGFIAITGAVGVGKTTILRSYLQTAQKDRLKIAYVFNPRLTFQELLKVVFRELGLVIESDDTTEMTEKLYGFLIDECRQGNTVVLVIDEAQNMPIDTLESLRMLSNFETPTDKLIQIVLVGQPEFDNLLKTDRLRPLNQRVAIRSTILPLTKEESLEYVAFRLSKAGSRLNSVFLPSALKRIVAKSKGTPRIINVLCDNALITGFGYRQKPVTNRIVREIIRDFSMPKPSPLARWRLSGSLTLASAFLVFLGFMLLTQQEGALLNGMRIPATGEPGISGIQVRQTVAVAEPPGKTAQKTPAPPSATDKPALATKVITRGDNLSRLAQEIYGRSNAEVIGLIRKENPQITNPNLIMAGSTITFPKVDGQDKQVGRQ